MSTVEGGRAPSLISMDAAKKRLALIWFAGSGLVFLIVLIQTLIGHYSSTADQVWSWLLPSVMPTLMLLVGVLVSDALQPERVDTRIDAFLFYCAAGFSIGYLLVILSTILLQPAPINATPLTLMHRSQLFLGPFQGLVSALLGAFFVKQQKKDAAVPK